MAKRQKKKKKKGRENNRDPALLLPSVPGYPSQPCRLLSIPACGSWKSYARPEHRVTLSAITGPSELTSVESASRQRAHLAQQPGPQKPLLPGAPFKWVRHSFLWALLPPATQVKGDHGRRWAGAFPTKFCAFLAPSLLWTHSPEVQLVLSRISIEAEQLPEAEVLEGQCGPCPGQMGGGRACWMHRAVN